MLNIIIEQYWAVAGYLKNGSIVMVPLLAVSVAMWTLIINRLLFFRRLYLKNMSRTTAGDYVLKNEMPSKKKYKGAVSFLVRRFLTRRTGDPDVDQYILDESVMEILTHLNRHLALIGVLAAVAPLLGLLGTVTGMITTFDVISVFGTGNAKAMAGGISEALITTQTGLVVAIPGLYMHGFLVKRADKLKTRVASTGIFLQRFIKYGSEICP